MADDKKKGKPQQQQGAQPSAQGAAAPQKKADADPFYIEKIFSDPAAILTYSAPSMSELNANALFVLDASAMLESFRLKEKNFGVVATILRRLAEADKLFVPVQAVREYGRNRGSEIAKVLQTMQEFGRTIEKREAMPELPVFDNLAAYNAAVAARKIMEDAIDAYKVTLRNLRRATGDWNWTDQVSRLYAELLPTRTISHGKTNQEVLDALDTRYKNKQPPGYEDAGKPDKGIGDLLIWFSILKLGTDRGRNVIYVTNETTKRDNTEVDGICAKFELVHEFHQETGRHFASVTFARFLELQDAPEETVIEVSDSITFHGKATASIHHATLSDLREVMGRIRSLAADLMNASIMPDFFTNSQYGMTRRKFSSAAAEADRIVTFLWQYLTDNQELSQIQSVLSAVHRAVEINTLLEGDGMAAETTERLRTPINEHFSKVERLVLSWLSEHDYLF